MVKKINTPKLKGPDSIKYEKKSKPAVSSSQGLKVEKPKIKFTRGKYI